MTDANGLSHTLADDKVGSDESRRDASNIIVSTLSDQVVRMVRSVSQLPSSMLPKLGKRYNSKSTASRIAKLVKPVSRR